ITVAGVPAAEVISSLTVKINLTHTFDSDLLIGLQAPDGRFGTLSAFNGADGHNYTNTVFDDAAATDIVYGTAPFTGSFRPEEQLGQLAGLNPNGDWHLIIDDDAGGDSGTLLGWSLTIHRGTPGPGSGNPVDQNSNGLAGEPA